MDVSVKACGIRTEKDLRTVLAAGVDRIGLICGTTHLSEDELSAAEAAALAAQVPDAAVAVLVTHLVDPVRILAFAREVGVGAIQLHGLVDAAAVAAVRAGAEAGRAGEGGAGAGVEVVRAVHVDERLDLARVPELAASADALLLDTRTRDRLGGTGLVHDWSVSARIRELVAAQGAPVYLAGGLTAENVSAAIEAVRPAGVDANSGLDDARGDKDPERVGGFVRAAARRA